MHPDSRSPRYLAAPVVTLVVGLGVLIGLIGAFVGLPILLAAFALPAGYLAGVVVASLTHVKDLPARSLLLLPGVLVTMHLGWGTGYLRGIG